MPYHPSRNRTSTNTSRAKRNNTPNQHRYNRPDRPVRRYRNDNNNSIQRHATRNSNNGQFPNVEQSIEMDVAGVIAPKDYSRDNNYYNYVGDVTRTTETAAPTRATIKTSTNQTQNLDDNYYYDSNYKNDSTEGKRSPLLRYLFYIAIVLLIAAIVLVAITFFKQDGNDGKKIRNDNSESNENNGINNRRNDPNYLLKLSKPIPFSLLDPVHDLNLLEYNQRPIESSPKDVTASWLAAKKQEQQEKQQRQMEDVYEELTSKGVVRTSLPTNSWYENLILLPNSNGGDDEDEELQRVYTIPYIIDTAGIVPGIRIHGATIWDTNPTNTSLQLSVSNPVSITIGSSVDYKTTTNADGTEVDKESFRYSVVGGTNLGVTLQWKVMEMKSTLVRGMAYATMTYPRTIHLTKQKQKLLPTIIASMAMKSLPIIDGNDTNFLNCDSVDATTSGTGPTQVQGDIKITYESGITWMVFFSRPVVVQCSMFDKITKKSTVQVIYDGSSIPLTIRAALLDDSNSIIDGVDTRSSTNLNVDEYETLLRRHASYYPGEETDMSYDVKDNTKQYTLELDWNVQDMTKEKSTIDQKKDGSELVMFALPHHMDNLVEDSDGGSMAYSSSFCRQSLFGPACIVVGNSWKMVDHIPRVSLYAPRSPKPEFLPQLIQSLVNDTKFEVEERYTRGAGDTYFSGKQLARLGRIILIANEVNYLCSGDNFATAYDAVCEESRNSLPSEDDTISALSRLRSNVEIWINGTAESPFVYDPIWGGIVNCGCEFDGRHCTNSVPDYECPAFSSHDFNFGNGFYNDHHFHYGYHIYAAAIVAQMDPEWGRRNFERVLLLIRNIANPSKHDSAFPRFRHKDIYQGSSWASGITEPLYFNGRNQESSSEAIAAYEAVALFGDVMVSAFKRVGENDKASIADEIRKAGLVLTATELRTTQRYWHVYHNDAAKQIYPSSYKPSVVGIVWNTLIELRTWFGNSPYLAYGIQTVPLTPIAEARDELEWALEVFPAFARECKTECVRNGWSNGELALLATIGHPELAIQQAVALSRSVFDTPGGNGHSRSNTIWYLATRPDAPDKFPLDQLGFEPFPENEAELDCLRPDKCTNAALDMMANGSTCRERILWLVDKQGFSVFDACTAVAVVDYPIECGACAPGS